MTASVSSSEYIPLINAAEELSEEHSEEITPAVQQDNVQTAQDQKKELLKKLLEQRDQTIQRQARAIDRITQENTELKEKIVVESQTNADIEVELARLQQENISLTRDADQLRRVQVPNVIYPPYPNQSLRAKALSVGKWFRRHVSFVHAGVGLGGAILAFVFSAYAAPIVLITGSLIAVTYGISKLFD